VKNDGYIYSRRARCAWNAREGAGDREGPCLSAGVQFYDVVIDGVRTLAMPGFTKGRALPS